MISRVRFIGEPPQSLTRSVVERKSGRTSLATTRHKSTSRSSQSSTKSKKKSLKKKLELISGKDTANELEQNGNDSKTGRKCDESVNPQLVKTNDNNQSAVAGELVRTLCLDRMITSCDISDDGLFICTALQGHCNIWSAFHFNLVATLNRRGSIAHRSNLKLLRFTPSSPVAIPTSVRNDTNEKDADITTTEQSEAESCSKISSGRIPKYIVTVGGDRKIVVWHVPTKRPLHMLQAHAAPVLDIRFETWKISDDDISEDGDGDGEKMENSNGSKEIDDKLSVMNIMFSSSADGDVLAWDWMRGKLIRKIASESSAIRSIHKHPLYGRLACACSDGKVAIWSVSNSMKSSVSSMSTRLCEIKADESWSERLKSRLDQETNLKYQKDAGCLSDPERSHTGAILIVRFSPDGRYLCTGSADCTAKVWSASSLRSDLNTVSTQKSNLIIASALVTHSEIENDSQDPIHDVHEETPITIGYHATVLHTLVHDGPVDQMEFSYITRWKNWSLFTTSRDCTCRMWDIESGTAQFQINLPSPATELHISMRCWNYRTLARIILSVENRILILELMPTFQRTIDSIVDAAREEIQDDYKNNASMRGWFDSQLRRLVKRGGMTREDMRKALAHGVADQEAILRVILERCTPIVALPLRFHANLIRYGIDAKLMLRTLIRTPHFAFGAILGAASGETSSSMLERYLNCVKDGRALDQILLQMGYECAGIDDTTILSHHRIPLTNLDIEHIFPWIARHRDSFTIEDDSLDNQTFNVKRKASTVGNTKNQNLVSTWKHRQHEVKYHLGQSEDSYNSQVHIPPVDSIVEVPNTDDNSVIADTVEIIEDEAKLVKAGRHKIRGVVGGFSSPRGLVPQGRLSTVLWYDAEQARAVLNDQQKTRLVFRDQAVRAKKKHQGKLVSLLPRYQPETPEDSGPYRRKTEKLYCTARPRIKSKMDTAVNGRMNGIGVLWVAAAPLPLSDESNFISANSRFTELKAKSRTVICQPISIGTVENSKRLLGERLALLNEPLASHSYDSNTKC